MDISEILDLLSISAAAQDRTATAGMEFDEEEIELPEIQSDSRNQGFLEFKERWADPEFRETYLGLKSDVGKEYQVDPAAYAGFIEESPALHKDIISASKETGVDPDFLYNVAMQEGLAHKMSILHRSNIKTKEFDPLLETAPLYESDRPIHTYTNIGLDDLFLGQPEAIRRGYLESAIKPSEKAYHYESDVYKGGKFVETMSGEDLPIELKYGNISLADTLKYEDETMYSAKYHESTGEKGFKFPAAYIKSKDALRGVGAIIRMNQDYLRSSFGKEGVDFDELSPKLQDFWTYASFNAGAGTATKLLKTYGSDPYSNTRFTEELTRQQKDLKAKETMTLEEKEKLTPEQYAAMAPAPLARWMENVGRVVGGTEITNLYKPFDYDEEVYSGLISGR